MLSHRTIAFGLGLSIACSTGCATQRGAIVVASIGATVAIGGLAYARLCDRSSSLDYDHPCMDEQLEGIALGGIGGLITLGALFNLAILALDGSKAEPPPTEPFPLVDPPEARVVDNAETVEVRREFARKRNDAWVLTKEARAASRDGDCETVKRLALQVLALDAEFHVTVFLTDVAIKRCLTPAITAPLIDATPAPQASPVGD